MDWMAGPSHDDSVRTSQSPATSLDFAEESWPSFFVRDDNSLVSRRSTMTDEMPDGYTPITPYNDESAHLGWPEPYASGQVSYQTFDDLLLLPPALDHDDQTYSWDMSKHYSHLGPCGSPSHVMFDQYTMPGDSVDVYSQAYGNLVQDPTRAQSTIGMAQVELSPPGDDFSKHAQTPIFRLPSPSMEVPALATAHKTRSRSSKPRRGRKCLPAPPLDGVSKEESSFDQMNDSEPPSSKHPQSTLDSDAHDHRHCPFTATSSCRRLHAEKTSDKGLAPHIKTLNCKVNGCQTTSFSSTACLLRHEREAHGQHGHGNRPFLCLYHPCERAEAGNGFPRMYNLVDHMKRVHRHVVPAKATPTILKANTKASKVVKPRRSKAKSNASSDQMTGLLTPESSVSSDSRRSSLTPSGSSSHHAHGTDVPHSTDSGMTADIVDDGEIDTPAGTEQNPRLRSADEELGDITTKLVLTLPLYDS